MHTSSICLFLAGVYYFFFPPCISEACRWWGEILMNFVKTFALLVISKNIYLESSSKYWCSWWAENCRFSKVRNSIKSISLLQKNMTFEAIRCGCSFVPCCWAKGTGGTWISLFSVLFNQLIFQSSGLPVERCGSHKPRYVGTLSSSPFFFSPICVKTK